MADRPLEPVDHNASFCGEMGDIDDPSDLDLGLDIDLDVILRELQDLKPTQESGEESYRATEKEYPERKARFQEIINDLLAGAPESQDMIDTESGIGDGQGAFMNYSQMSSVPSLPVFENCTNYRSSEGDAGISHVTNAKSESEILSVPGFSDGAEPSCNIKDLLRENVKLKMAQEGKSFEEDPQQQAPMVQTEEEKRKDEARKTRNKESAKRSREKRELLTKELSQNNISLQEESESLIKATKDSVKYLIRQVDRLVNLHKVFYGCQGWEDLLLFPRMKSFLKQVQEFCSKEGAVIGQESGGRSLDYFSSHCTARSSMGVLPDIKYSNPKALCLSSSSSTATTDSTEPEATFMEQLQQLAISAHSLAEAVFGTSDGTIRHNGNSISHLNNTVNVFGNGLTFKIGLPIDDPPAVENGAGIDPSPPPLTGNGYNDHYKPSPLPGSEHSFISHSSTAYDGGTNLVPQHCVGGGNKGNHDARVRDNCNNIATACMNEIPKYVGRKEWKNHISLHTAGIDYHSFNMKVTGASNSTFSAWEVGNDNAEMGLEADVHNMRLDSELDQNSCTPSPQKKPRLA